MRKYFKTSLGLLVFVTSATVWADAAQFVGRFRPNAASCNGGFSSAERIYSQILTDRLQRQRLDFTGYGVEARGLHIMLGSGERQAAGTVVDVHGQVTESWVTTIAANVLTSVVRVVRPSTNYSSEETITVTNNGPSMIVQATFSSNSGAADTESCEIVRY